MAVYTGFKFFGSTVRSIAMTLGYGGDTSEVSLELVEDLRNGDSFTSGSIGAPYSIQLSGLRFDGILQSQERQYDTSSNPTYSIRLRSPNDFLEAQSLIISNYTGTVGSVPNLMNLYGFWENKFGFGGSLINDLGMVWEGTNYNVTVVSGTISTGTVLGTYGIKPGIEALQSGANIVFGSGFQYNGHRYKFDFSQIGTVDPNWRFNGDGGSARLIDVIENICADKGLDYYISLTATTGFGPHTLTINTIDRKIPPQLGKIQEYIDNQQYVSSKNIGQELTVQQSSLFLVGANIESMFQQTTPTNIIPFWGFNYDGTPVIGTGSDDAHTFTVPCPEIADIVGAATYTMTVAELRCALSNEDIWAGYVIKNNPTLASAITLASCFSSNDTTNGAFGDYRFSYDFINQGALYALEFSKMNNSNNWTRIHRAVYQFIRNYADNYYGKRFIVKTPVVLQFKYEPDTANLKWNWEPVNEAYVDNGSNLLNLNAYYQNRFMSPDSNKMNPVVKYTFESLSLGISGADINRFNATPQALQAQSFYTACNFIDEAGIFFIGPQSCVAIELPDSLYTIADDALGGVATINNLFNTSASDWALMRNGSTAGQYHPAAIKPTSVALPFKSNTLTYGPWISSSGAGKTEYRKEDSLAPWNYGGYIYMEAAASGILQNFVRGSRINENGSVTIPGLPDRNLGQQIQAYGPNITHINIEMSTNAVTTTYNFRTHTQRPGAFGKLRLERLALIGNRQNKFGRQLLSIGDKISQNATNNLAAQTYNWREGISRAVRQESPHGTIVGFQTSAFLPKSSITGYMSLISTQTYEESLANATYTGFFYNAACSSWDAVLRPFSCSVGYSGLMPKLSATNGTLGANAIKQTDLNHFGGANDIDWFLYGDSYNGMHARKNTTTVDYTSARIMGLRSPIYAVGWGYDVFGKPSPNPSGANALNQVKSTNFLTNYRVRSDQWNAGPVGLFWDQRRKLWTIPTTVQCYLLTNIAADSDGTAATYYGGGIESETFTVHNFFSTALTSGKKAIASYDQWEGRYNIIAVDC